MPTPWQAGTVWATPQVDEGSLTLIGYEGPSVFSPPATSKGLVLTSTPPSISKPADYDTGTAEGGPGTTRSGGGLFPDLPAPYYYSGFQYGLCAILETWGTGSTYPAHPSGDVIPVSFFLAEKHQMYPAPVNTVGWGWLGGSVGPAGLAELVHTRPLDAPHASGDEFNPYSSNATINTSWYKPPSTYFVNGSPDFGWGDSIDRSYVLEGGSLSGTTLSVGGEDQTGDYYALGDRYMVGDDTGETWPDPSLAFAPGGWRIGATAWRDNYVGETAPDQTCQETAHARVTWLMFQYVYGPDGSIYPPPGGGAYSLYGLSADTHPFGVTRMVYNVGFNSNALSLRRFYGQMGAPSDVSLPFTGQSPDILCRDEGRHLIAASDGANVLIKQIDDEGSVIATMPSPGAGKLVSLYQSRKDAISPVWVAFCTADSDTGDIKVYRTMDPLTLTGWDAAVTVASGVPAQKPTVTGDMARLMVSYHDGAGAIQTKYSTDNGATWTLSS